MACSLVLLTTAGLFVRAVAAGASIDPGFDAAGVALASFNTQSYGYDETRGRAFYAALRQRLEATPGVEAVTYADRIPLTMSNSGATVSVDGAGADGSNGRGCASRWDSSTPATSRRSGSGCCAAASSRPRTSPAATPSRSSTRRSRGVRGPNASPADAVGRTLPRRGHGRSRSSASPLIRSTRRSASRRRRSSIVRRRSAGTRDERCSFGSTATQSRRGRSSRTAVASIDPLLPRVAVTTLTREASMALLPQRVAAIITGVLGVAGVVLAAIGLYGLVSYGVTLRLREIGVRLALGASRGDVVRMVLAQGLRLTAVGRRPGPGRERVRDSAGAELSAQRECDGCGRVHRRRRRAAGRRRPRGGRAGEARGLGRSRDGVAGGLTGSGPARLDRRLAADVYRAHMTLPTAAAEGGADAISGFEAYILGAAYDEMFAGHGEARPQYAEIWARLQKMRSGAPARASGGRRRRLPSSGHHVHRLRQERRDRAHLPLRPHPAHHHRGGVAGRRARPDAAAHGAQPVPPGSLLRRAGPRRRHRASPPRLQLQALPPRDAGRAGAARRLRRRGRHRPRAAARRDVRGARGQPARAERRELHAEQPAGDQAHFPDAVQSLRRAAGRSVRQSLLATLRGARASALARSARRAADAGHLQLGLLRAHLPGAADGHRAGRRPRPLRPRQRRLHADDRRARGAWT